MFADLDATLRELLIRYVPVNPAEIELSFDTPDREWSGKLTRPAINCFLYEVHENHKLRAAAWETRRGANTATRQKGPLRVDACYQVTTWARAYDDQHRLLWRVLAALARHPTLPTDLLVGGLKDQPLPVTTAVAQPDQQPANVGDLWHALDNRIRVALTYVVTLCLDPELVLSSPLVLFKPEFHVEQLTRQEVAQGNRVRGRVWQVDNPTQPVAGALVTLSETGDRMLTDADGRFAFEGLPRGPITMVVQAAGRPPTTHAARVPTGEHYDLRV
jgi:hypothetical protein